MARKRQGIQSLAKNALAAVSSPQYSHLYLSLDGLKNYTEEASRLIVTCKKKSKTLEKK